MTELLSRELSRKSFLKGGGTLVVGFSLVGSAFGTKAKAAYDPDRTLVDSWVSVGADNTVTIKTSQIELGQGIITGLLMIAAEELDVSMSQMRHSGWDTDILVNSGGTGGSTGIQTSVGPPLRAAAASAKQALLGLAATRLGVPASGLSVANGVVSGGGKSVTYGELVGDKLLNAKLVAPALHPGVAPAKPVGQYRLIGSRVPRVDIPDKVDGKHTYVHNVKLPGMLHGRVVRPRGQGPYGTGAPIVSVDAGSIKKIPGARIVRKGDFLGVVAPREFDAIQAASQLKVTWKESALLPSTGNLWKRMREHDSAGRAPAARAVDFGNVDTAIAGAAKTVTATYKFHYNGRMPIGPCCAVADVRPERTTIFSNTQGVIGMVPAIASQLGIETSKVRSLFYEGASTFGSSQSVDAARAAALMSQVIGRPVRVQLMRWDEHGWDNYGYQQLMDMRGAIDANGKLVAYDYTVLGQPGTRLDLTVELTGEAYPAPGLHSPNAPNAGPMYDVANRRHTGKTMPLFEGYLKNGALRDPYGPETAFASEQLIDELAYAANMDPLEFRRRNIDPARGYVPGAARGGGPGDGERWLTVLDAVAAAAKWQPRVANSVRQTGNTVKGRGFSFGRHGVGAYAAGVAEIEVNKRTGKITVRHIYNGVDAGLVINPGLVENQMQGAAVQGISRALHEQVGFTTKRVNSLDWVSYPILRFLDSPKVTNVLLQRKEHLPLGVGEPATTPPAAAIANAFFDATGVRIREAPMTPAKVRAVLKAAGVK